ncbi:MAG TPA: permease [Clostridiales bacterium UBA8960]|jgi:uncharacterized membrane protein YraQ (UPF0718 family)|nr:permease [Clostridiales bacterium UBA8960]
MKTAKHYKWTLVVFAILGLLLIFIPEIGKKATWLSLSNFANMFAVLPPIMLLIGLLDVWVPKEVMIKFMGEKSGVLGILVAFLLGALAAGPLYAAFPIAAILLKKNARLSYVIFFLGVWSTAKLPLVMFEIASFGGTFTAIHILSNLTVFLIGAFALEKTLTKESKEGIYQLSANMIEG